MFTHNQLQCTVYWTNYYQCKIYSLLGWSMPNRNERIIHCKLFCWWYFVNSRKSITLYEICMKKTSLFIRSYFEHNSLLICFSGIVQPPRRNNFEALCEFTTSSKIRAMRRNIGWHSIDRVQSFERQWERNGENLLRTRKHTRIHKTHSRSSSSTITIFLARLNV